MQANQEASMHNARSCPLLGVMMLVAADWHTFWLQYFLCGGAGDWPKRLLHNTRGVVQPGLVYSAPIALSSTVLHADAVHSQGFQRCMLCPRIASKNSISWRTYLDWHANWYPLPSPQLQGHAACHDELHAARQTPRT